MNLRLDTGPSNSGLFLGLPDNKGRTKEQAVASDRVTIIRTTRPRGIRVSLQLEGRLARVKETAIQYYGDSAGPTGDEHNELK